MTPSILYQHYWYMDAGDGICNNILYVRDTHEMLVTDLAVSITNIAVARGYRVLYLY